MRLAVIHVGQETNDFNPVPTTLRDFQAFGIFEGADMVERVRGVGQAGGFLAAIDESGDDIEVVPIIRGWATAGGRIDDESLEYFRDKIRAGLAAAGPLDGLALQLHGACAATGVDDVEGQQLALCRSILGDALPIVLSLDHHANVTTEMVRLSTAIVAHRTQPHDPFDTGKLAGHLLVRIARGEVQPRTAWRKLRLLSHQEQFLTARGPMKIWFDRAREMERDPRVLQISNFPMQPWLDVAEGGWATVVITDGEPALAEQLADELAELAWSMRETFQKLDAVAVDEAVNRAERAERGLVVLSDTGDTVFGGAAGDSNVILEAMLRLGTSSPALIPMVAPRAVARLAQAGEGARVSLPLGGESTPFFEPMTVTGTVRRVGGGRVQVAEHHQRDVDMGQAVIFDVGPVSMLITELRGMGGNVPDVYRHLGVEPRDYKVVVVKTASNFQYFASMTSELIRVDSRGPGQSNIAGLPWRRIPRPIYPLDDIASWRG